MQSTVTALLRSMLNSAHVGGTFRHLDHTTKSHHLCTSHVEKSWAWAWTMAFFSLQFSAITVDHCWENRLTCCFLRFCECFLFSLGRISSSRSLERIIENRSVLFFWWGQLQYIFNGFKITIKFPWAARYSQINFLSRNHHTQKPFYDSASQMLQQNILLPPQHKFFMLACCIFYIYLFFIM